MFRPALVVVLAAVWAGCSRTHASERPSPVFYTDKPYGSEAEFSPMAIVVNEGYDILQVRGVDRHVFRFGYGGAFHNVVTALKDPVPSITSYGVRKFATHELFPASRPPDGGQWFPNYTQHLIGGGMNFARLREWYELHDAPAPLLQSIVVYGAAHLLNETVENGTWRGPGTDPIADLYVFDIGGWLLFSSGAVQRFFGTELNLTSWPGQPGLSVPDYELHNVFMSYVARWRIPATERWHLLYYFGETPLAGLSFRSAGGDGISVGAGGAVTDLVVLDSATNRKGIRLTRVTGIFWDRNNSLMASVIYGVKPNKLLINVYPSVLHIGAWHPGLWARVPSAGGLQFGLSAPWSVGVATRARD